MNSNNPKYDLGGINHLALVCLDMKRTIAFYSGTLGMPLIKTIELPGNLGQHFFFDCGGGNSLAFFWLADSPGAAPGIAAPKGRPDEGELASAVGSMNHVAFTVPLRDFEEYYRRLQTSGVEVSRILNHDDSAAGVSRGVNDTTFVRSFYFQDPDGILLEFASWTREFDESDTAHEPKSAADRNARSSL